MSSDAPEYVEAHLHERLARDPRTAELGIHISVRPPQVNLAGSVPSAERRDTVAQVVAEALPRFEIINEISIAASDAPGEPEKLS